ncbi:hypothetical protein B0H11DRAFT_2203544 [Mycena galericulata]|nr:hypothetical protein B0H11DRAFT_2203544 [Mycena galericulata]
MLTWSGCAPHASEPYLTSCELGHDYMLSDGEQERKSEMTWVILEVIVHVRVEQTPPAQTCKSASSNLRDTEQISDSSGAQILACARGETGRILGDSARRRNFRGRTNAYRRPAFKFGRKYRDTLATVMPKREASVAFDEDNRTIPRSAKLQLKCAELLVPTSYARLPLSAPEPLPVAVRFPPTSSASPRHGTQQRKSPGAQDVPMDPQAPQSQGSRGEVIEVMPSLVWFSDIFISRLFTLFANAFIRAERSTSSGLEDIGWASDIHSSVFIYSSGVLVPWLAVRAGMRDYYNTESGMLRIQASSSDQTQSKSYFYQISSHWRRDLMGVANPDEGHQCFSLSVRKERELIKLSERFNRSSKNYWPSPCRSWGWPDRYTIPANGTARGLCDHACDSGENAIEDRIAGAVLKKKKKRGPTNVGRLNHERGRCGLGLGCVTYALPTRGAAVALSAVVTVEGVHDEGGVGDCKRLPQALGKPPSYFMDRRVTAAVRNRDKIQFEYMCEWEAVELGPINVGD